MLAVTIYKIGYVSSGGITINIVCLRGSLKKYVKIADS